MLYLVAGLTAGLLAMTTLIVRLVFQFVELERAHQDTERAQIAAERASWGEERRELLLRIQAPAEAVVQQITAQPFPTPPAVSFDDDSDHWAAKAGVSKEDLARLNYEAETAAA